MGKNRISTKLYNQSSHFFLEDSKTDCSLGPIMATEKTINISFELEKVIINCVNISGAKPLTLTLGRFIYK